MPRKPNAEPLIGDNSGDDTSARNVGGVAGEQLKSFIDRLENLIEDKKAVQGDISEVFGELTSAGFNAKVVRAIIKKRAEDADKRAEFETELELYEQALGIFG